MSNFITVCESNKNMTKTFTKNGVLSYDNGYQFKYFEKEVNTIDDLHAILVDLAPRSQCAILRAKAKVKFGRRKVKGSEATLECPAMNVMMADIDDTSMLTFPEGATLEEQIDYAVVNLMPKQFHNSSYIYQLSSSYGMKPGLKMHVWFYLENPLTGDQLKDTLADVEIDEAPFRPGQIHYTASPLFKGVKDPVNVPRIALVTKRKPTVKLKAKKVTPKAAPRPVLTQTQLEDIVRMLPEGNEMRVMAERILDTMGVNRAQTDDLFGDIKTRHAGTMHHPELFRVVAACKGLGYEQDFVEELTEVLKDGDSGFSVEGTWNYLDENSTDEGCGYTTLANLAGRSINSTPDFDAIV